jgi:hypothetical protein
MKLIIESDLLSEKDIINVLNNHFNCYIEPDSKVSNKKLRDTIIFLRSIRISNDICEDYSNVTHTGSI